ncbi:MAG: lipopolysaccharide assembly protein LapA domain-containing protein [Gammaproteobacteria bacterium]|jgi:uncharacterized integral membrane protein
MVVVLRRLAIIAIAVVFVLIAAVFAYGNQEPIDLDIGIMRIEEISLTIVLAFTFVFGTCFGVVISAGAMLKHFRERRSLRRELRRAETELKNVRGLSLPDAD